MVSAEIKDALNGSNSVVTGGTGLIGREVVKLLVDSGANVKIISLDKVEVNNDAEHVYGDLTNFDFCADHFAGADFVFHLAGIKGSVKVTTEKPASFFVPLLMFNTNVLEAARRCGVQKLVYTSSIGAYSDAEIFFEKDEDDNFAPMDMFPGWAKRMAEKQIQAYKIEYGMENFSVVRPCNVYGPGDNFDPETAMVIPTLMSRIYRGENPVVVWGDGSAIRDFAFSRDVAEGVIRALHFGTQGGYVNLGSGIGVSIKQLVETLAKFIDFEYRFDVDKPSGFPKRVMDVKKAEHLIGYAPQTKLIDGLKETWDWFQMNHSEHRQKQNYFS